MPCASSDTQHRVQRRAISQVTCLPAALIWACQRPVARSRLTPLKWLLWPTPLRARARSSATISLKVRPAQQQAPLLSGELERCLCCGGGSTAGRHWVTPRL